MITLLSNSQKLRKLVAEIASPLHVNNVDVRPRTFPTRADAIVSSAAISSSIALLEAELRAWAGVYVLPEAQHQLGQDIRDGKLSVLAGNDLIRADRAAGLFA